MYWFPCVDYNHLKLYLDLIWLFKLFVGGVFYRLCCTAVLCHGSFEQKVEIFPYSSAFTHTYPSCLLSTPARARFVLP